MNIRNGNTIASIIQYRDLENQGAYLSPDPSVNGPGLMCPFRHSGPVQDSAPPFLGYCQLLKGCVPLSSA